jgi:two-component system LytT family response regulator
MPDGTGFDLLRKLERTDFHLVFITAHEQYAIEAFRFCALDYLLKPLQPDELIATVQRIENISSAPEDIRFRALMEYMTSAEKKKRKIVLKTLERIYSIEISSILRLEAEGSYTNVYLADGNKIMVSRQLKEFDELLSPNGYLRVHQSHLVNTEHLFYFDKSESYLVLKDNSSVPVSSRKKELVLEVLNSL